jgi:hypothetical protein
MECNGCDGCGKTYPEIQQIHMCKCFLAAFCTPECFEQSEHKLDCELIDGTWDRVRGKAALTDFSAALSKYAEIMLGFVRDYYRNVASPDVEMLNDLTNSIQLLDQTRQNQLRAGLNVWNQHLVDALNATFDKDPISTQDSLDKAEQLETAVISIFKAENRLSLRQSGKDIERAWKKYADALRRAILLASDSTRATVNFKKAARLGEITGQVLSGKGYVNEKFELIEGPLSRVRGKSDFGQQLSQYTWSLYYYAEATGADKQMKQAESYALLQNIKARDEKRNGDLQTLLKGWNNKNILAINYMQNGEKRSAEAELNQVKGASDTLIAIFKSENRLSLKQRGKNIENAWNAYLQSLRESILNIPKTGEDLNYAYSKFNDTATMAVNVGNVLGGGKDMAK